MNKVTKTNEILPPKEAHEAHQIDLFSIDAYTNLWNENAALRAEVETQKKAFKRCLDAMREEYQKREDLKYSSTIDELRAELEAAEKRADKSDRYREELQAELERVITKCTHCGHNLLHPVCGDHFLWDEEVIARLQRELDEAKRNGHCCDGFGSNCPREERRRRQEAHDKRHPS